VAVPGPSSAGRLTGAREDGTCHERRSRGVKSLARGGTSLAALAIAGCAQPDWIERTLVTVDVTGE